MKLSYEYNEYIVGYIVTDIETDRTLNFQFEKFKQSNHPEPAYELYAACAGDDTHKNWTEEEITQARDWLRFHYETLKLEEAFTSAMYENEDFKNWSAPIESWQILEARV